MNSVGTKFRRDLFYLRTSELSSELAFFSAGTLCNSETTSTEFLNIPRYRYSMYGSPIYMFIHVLVHVDEHENR